MIKSFLLVFLSLGFFLCLGVAQSQSTPGEKGSTGVAGIISISPVQGGPTRQGAPDSKPLGNMAFVVKQGDNVIKSFQTDSAGRFRVDLQPGHYTIVRKDWTGAIGSYGPFEVAVSEGKMTSVDWKCDSGLR